jgi:hypothetical protein
MTDQILILTERRRQHQHQHKNLAKHRDIEKEIRNKIDLAKVMRLSGNYEY